MSTTTTLAFDIVKVVTFGTRLKSGRATQFRYVTKSLTPHHAALRDAAMASGQYAETIAYGTPFNVAGLGLVEQAVIGTVGDRRMYAAARR